MTHPSLQRGRTPNPYRRRGLLLATAGTLIGLCATLVLGTQGRTILVPSPDCIGPSCPEHPYFNPYIPPVLAELLILAAVLPLICLARPHLWKVGALAVTLSEGGFGALVIGEAALAAAFGQPPPDFGSLPGLAVPFWVVGSLVTAWGFWTLRPREPTRGSTTGPAAVRS